MQEWSPSPARVFSDYDCNPAVYDKVRFLVTSLDPDPAQWVTPRSGAPGGNKIAGSKHVHSSGLQLWIKRHEGKWAVFLGLNHMTIGDVFGNGAEQQWLAAPLL